MGAALAEALLERRWIARVPDSRALAVTAAGRKKLAELKVADYAIEPPPVRSTRWRGGLDAHARTVAYGMLTVVLSPLDEIVKVPAADEEYASTAHPAGGAAYGP